MLIIFLVIVGTGALFACAGFGRQVEAVANFTSRWIARTLIVMFGLGAIWVAEHWQ